MNGRADLDVADVGHELLLSRLRLEQLGALDDVDALFGEAAEPVPDAAGLVQEWLTAQRLNRAAR